MWNFYEFITKVNISDNSVLVYFDVTSLYIFKNILPINLIINIIQEKFEVLSIRTFRKIAVTT